MTHLRHVTAMSIFGAIGLILTGCGGGGGGNDGPADAGGPPAASAALTRAADCDELLTALRTDARAKIAVQADELRAHGWAYGGGIGDGSPTPVATPAAQATQAPGGGRPPDATDTNTQVPGVDEADVVETDGNRIYLLHENELVVLTSSPPAATALAERISIEGYPHGMFVADGRALVLSAVYDDGSLGGDPSCGGIGAPFPTSPQIENPGSTFIPTFQSCQAVFTKLTLLDVAATPSRVVRELYVEGTYVAARRHGDRARVIVQRSWGTPASVRDPWDVLWASPAPTGEADFIVRVDAWERDALAAIDASTLAEWLPAERERVGDAFVDRELACGDVYVPPAALARQGATVIVGLDLATADAPLDTALLLGDASEVYANADTLVLAHPEWQDEPLGDASTRTALHVFALNGTGVAYLGSGFVPGTLLSQFALDVHDDVVRVATSFVSELTRQTATRVTTARIAEDTLVTLGASENLAPGEQLRGARFLGDRAYLVTFVQVDPLFVIDLSDPAHPRTLGEVTLPGFSEYLHPLDAEHLLTIGRAATNQGQPLGVALRIFDVTEPTAPTLSAEYVLPGNGSSPAETDHLAFTFEPRLGLLALPFNEWEVNYSRGTLRLFEVSAETGIQPRGVVDHGDAGTTAPCAPPFDWESCFVSEWMERGLFIDDLVYSISTSSVQVHALDDLETPLAKVTLP